MSLRLHVYVGDGYSFFINVPQSETVRKLLSLVEYEINHLFEYGNEEYRAEPISVLGIRDQGFNDIPLHLSLCTVFCDNDPLFPLLDLVKWTDMPPKGGEPQRTTATLHSAIIALCILPREDILVHTAINRQIAASLRAEILSKAQFFTSTETGGDGGSMLQKTLAECGPDSHQLLTASAANAGSSTPVSGDRDLLECKAEGDAAGRAYDPGATGIDGCSGGHRGSQSMAVADGGATFVPGSSENKCRPYCMPLAEYGDCMSICPTCNEIKAYCPVNGLACTQYCRSGEVMKLKSNGLSFCSICISRYRQSKYPRGCQHQCIICQRPWLRLNNSGVCRSCHCLNSEMNSVPFQASSKTLSAWKRQK